MKTEKNMTGVNKTLYIPLYGKAYVSRRGLFLHDAKAEEIWAAEQFPLNGKSASKWLAFYMGIRAAVFDGWVRERIAESKSAAVLHIGCGMDSRVLRAGAEAEAWYDVDFPEVISERKRYYEESERYKMTAGDVREPSWLGALPRGGKAIVVMEGVSMYLSQGELCAALEAICAHFDEVELLADCYSVLAAKLSRYKNPINDVGVTRVHGIDDPLVLQAGGLLYVKEHDMTPQKYTEELRGAERAIFKRLYAGKFARKLYKMYEYRKTK